jgi:hypothetical protein
MLVNQCMNAWLTQQLSEQTADEQSATTVSAAAYRLHH